MAKRSKSYSQPHVKGASGQSGGASPLEIRDAKRVWDQQQQPTSTTASKKAKASRPSFEKSLKSLPQHYVIPSFLKHLEESNLWERRDLISYIPTVVRPGVAWQSLLREHKNKDCHGAILKCLQPWNETQVIVALIQGTRQAFHDADRDKLLYLQFLILEVTKTRPNVSLRPLERWLWKQCQKRVGWQRRPTEHAQQAEILHNALIQSIAPADTPLVAMPPTTDHNLPIVAGAAESGTNNLPMPAESTELYLSEPWWKQWMKRFKRL